ncbi:MAG: hypothetical protein KHW49_07365 [Eubacterium sp.]|nr:hypothetical protein [Eubacterium sp.]
MWQKLAPCKKFEAEKQQKQDKSGKNVAFHTREISAFGKSLRARRKATSEKATSIFVLYKLPNLNILQMSPRENMVLVNMPQVLKFYKT